MNDFSKFLLKSAREEAEKYFDHNKMICLIPRETIWYSICLLESNKTDDVLLANKILENITASDGTHSQSSLVLIWYKFQKLLSDMAKSNIIKNIRETINISAFTKYNDGNVNHPIAAYCNLICGGEILGKNEVTEIGKFYLKEFKKSISKESYSYKQTQISEYNSPTYTAVTLWFLNIISAYSKDPECKELAKSLEMHLWIDVALHFHQPTLQFAGPFSRAYQDDSIGGYSALHCTMIKAIESDFFINPEISHKYNHPSNFIQNALIAELNFNLPEDFCEIAFRKNFPLYFRQKTFCEQYFENRTKNISGKKTHIFDDECYAGGWSDLTTYMTENYSLACSERQYVNGGHTDAFVFRYKRNTEINEMKDFRSIHLRGIYNESIAGKDNYCHITDSLITKDFLYEEGRSGIFQYKNRAMVCYFPKRSGCIGVRSFRIDIIFSCFSEFDSIFINERKVTELPSEFSYDDRIFIKDADVLFLIVPFKKSGIPNLRNTIRIENDLLIISLYSYNSVIHDYTREEINQLVNGFFFEVLESSEVESFNKFIENNKSCKLKLEDSDNIIYLEMQGPDYSMKMKYDYLREKMIERIFNGNEQFFNSFDIETNDENLINILKTGYWND